MPYREPTALVTPSPQRSRHTWWQHLKRWWVTLDVESTDDQKKRQWAGGRWARIYRPVGPNSPGYTLSRGYWVPVEECPYTDTYRRNCDYEEWP